MGDAVMCKPIAICDAPGLTVIIVAYRGDRWLPECLRTLRGAARVTPMRLVLVDNGFNTIIDSLPLHEFNHTLLRTPRPLGFAEANNYALQHAPPRTRAVCFLNQDTRSMPGWLDACVACLDEHPAVGALCPLTRTYDEDGWDAPFLECGRRSPAFEAARAGGGELMPFYEVPLITAAAAVLRTEALHQAGPFDPIFGSYYEDFDLCRRVREAGYTIGICTDATVCHYNGGSSSSAEAERKRMRQVLRNRAIYDCRVAGARRGVVAAAQFLTRLPRRLARAAVRSPSAQPPGVVLAAHWDLLKVSGRLVSRRRDERAWQRYLATIGWPSVAASNASGRETA